MHVAKPQKNRSIGWRGDDECGDKPKEPYFNLAANLQTYINAELTFG